jgi:hypothetical protein
LDQRLHAVEETVHAANASVAQLAAAHEALKYAVADDFSVLARDTAARLSAGLEDVRAAAEAAAAQADAAVSHLIAELRNVRETVEARLQESAAATRTRMQAAFADAAERMDALVERVSESERLAARSAEQLRAQLADVEDGAQTAIEETAETLRQITPRTKLVSYEIEMKRVIQRKLHMGVGDGVVKADGAPIYSAKDLKVGLFSPEQLEAQMK